MTTTEDGVAHYDVTREALIGALAALPLGGYLVREARERHADLILARLPEASEAAFYMEGAKAERERIEGLFGDWIGILMQEPNSHPPEAWKAAFAELIQEQP